MDSSKKLPEIWNSKRLLLRGQRVNLPLMLAPMVGLTHAPFRQICQSYLPAGSMTLWPTEMLNSRKLPRENVGNTPETLRTPLELHHSQDLIPQILGNEEEFIRESVHRLKNWGARAIDINMGCPVEKALKHNYGVALMGDPQYAGLVVKMVKNSTELPVAVKLRAGENGSLEALKNFTDVLIQSGADWLTLHPRTAEQKRRGKADWSQIRFLKENTSIPIIGNGDIQTLQDIEDMLSNTGCDYVMIGRAATARPWIFWQLGEKWGLPNPIGRIGHAPSTPEEEAQEYGKMVLESLKLHEQYFTKDVGLRKFRFFIKNSSVWLDYGHSLFALTTKYNEFPILAEKLEEFFRQELKLVPRTELRQ